MNITRRHFVGWLLGLPVAALLARRNETGGTRAYQLNHFNIAGFQYYRGPQLVRAIRPGEHLKLAAEPDNAYDPFAVRIERKGVKLVYVPRRENRHLGRLLKQRAPLVCRVTNVRPNAAPWEMVTVEVGMLG